ncbi:MAG: hypothetical protein AAGF71_06120 [Pseudomonadota bacterium]
MADLPEQAIWHDGIYQIEQTDPVLGGVPVKVTHAGVVNIPNLELADRTRFLKEGLDALSANAPRLTDFGNDLLATGYQRLPGGLIIQWGEVAFANTTNDGNFTVTLPVAYPNAHLQVIVGHTFGYIGGGGQTEGIAINQRTLSTFVFSNHWSGSVDDTARYISLGF